MLVALLLASPLAADVTLSGTVTDLAGAPKYATVVVYDSGDKHVVAHGNTGLSGAALGKFSFSVPTGTYDIYARIFGNVPREVTNVSVQGNVVKDVAIDTSVAASVPTYLKTMTTTTPAVFINDPASTTTITLTATQSAGGTIALYNEFGQFTLDGVAYGTIALYDDGTHGDAKAGDFIYTRSGLGTTAAPSQRCNTMTSASFFYGRINGAMTSVPSVEVIGVKPLATPLPVTVLATGAQASVNAANVVLDIPNTSTKGWEKTAAKEFYKSFGDVYDFLFIFPGTRMGGVSGITTVVRNDVTGIGLPISDDGLQFGSAGKLQAVMAINFSSDPPLLHEIMHRWANYLPSFDTTYLSHWGYSGVNGVLGGFDQASLVQNGDGSYTVASVAGNGYSNDFSAAKQYAPLERYLAGFATAASVPSFASFTNVKAIGGSDTHFTGTRTNLDGNAIVGQLGPRNPSSASSQKSFRVAFVAVTKTPLNAAGMTYLATLAQQFSAANGCINSFPAMSGGVASMDPTIITKAPPRRRASRH